MRPSLRQVLFRSAGLDLNFAGGVFSLNNTRTASPAAIPGWSFSRTDTNGTATALDLAGNVIQFATGVPRITNRGILVEEARTNNILFGTQLDNAAWTTQRVSVTANTIAAPDGTVTADSISEDGATGSHGIFQGITKALSSLTYTASCFFKPANRTWGLIALNSAGETNGVRAYYDLSGSGAVGSVSLFGAGFSTASGTIQALANGWYRCTVTVTTDSTASVTLAIRAATGDGGQSYTGGSQLSLYAWGAQLELGAFATSPIITTGAAGTRGADASTMGSFVFPAAHTFVVETQAPVLQTGLFPTSFSSTGTNVGLLVTGSTNVSGANMGNATFNDVYGSAVSAGGTIKNAFRAETNNARGCLNGTLSALDATFTPVVGSQTLNIGAANGSASYWNSYVQRIRVLPFAATDAQLQSLTAP
jgi:hypothetical protein